MSPKPRNMYNKSDGSVYRRKGPCEGELWPASCKLNHSRLNQTGQETRPPPLSASLVPAWPGVCLLPTQESLAPLYVSLRCGAVRTNVTVNWII
jgi:hypothetical protein